MTDSSWARSRASEFAPSVDTLGGWHAVALGTGTMAGLATFVAAKASLAPVDSAVALLAVGVAGAFVPVLIRSLRASVAALLVGYVVGWFVLFGAWILPWILLSFRPGAVELFLYRRLGLMAIHAISSLFLPYVGGYLLAVVVVSLLDPRA